MAGVSIVILYASRWYELYPILAPPEGYSYSGMSASAVRWTIVESKVFGSTFSGGNGDVAFLGLVCPVHPVRLEFLTHAGSSPFIRS